MIWVDLAALVFAMLLFYAACKTFTEAEEIRAEAMNHLEEAKNLLEEDND